MSYAIISLGGKQYRVREGERLLVDRLPHAEQKTFHPRVLMVGGNGDAEFDPKGVQVTVRVVSHTLGEKIRIGKSRPKSGYRRHTGYRSRLSQIEIEAIGGKAAAPKEEPKAEVEAKPKVAPKPRPQPAAKPEAKPKAETKPKPKAEAEPKAEPKPKAGAAAKKPAARKPAAKKTET